MRGLKTDQAASIVTGGPAFIQTLRRGHYALTGEIRAGAGATGQLRRAIGLRS